ncbi:MAG: hypothetical protein HYZ37_05865 [Candidatus Solibacter usitatus]|nr:hypothetical protein [Candidatus Solibacter usitatus]
MKRITIGSLFAVLLAAAWIVGGERPSRAQGAMTSGQGKMKFRVLFTSSHLPQEAQNVLKGAHGGFAIDLRPGKGETYFSLKGAGIIQISPDLKRTKMVDTAADMKGTNLHNTNIWYGADGTPFLVFPGNESNRVFTTDLSGKLLHTLTPPDAGSDLGHPTVNEYFKNNGKFIPTDVEQLDGLYYMTTGYSPLDFVLTAKIQSTKPFKATWHDLAFGGRGKGPGQFGTGHGITVPPGTKRLDIADRPNSEVDRFTKHGQYLSTVKLPEGSFPCDTYFLGKYMVIGALHGPDRTKGAPIYILENDQVISTIMAKEELGLKNFQHIHNAVMREINGKYYVIAQAWNPGDFAILEQVSD